MPEQHAETLALAQRALTRGFTNPVCLTLSSPVVDYPGAAAIVLRCRMQTDDSNIPKSVIVKRSMSPDNHLLREWSNLEFLTTLEPIRPLIPALYAGDESGEILIMEDLEPGRELLGNIVEGTEPEVATAGPIAFHRALGTLHGDSIGKETEFRRFTLRGNAATASRHVIHRIQETFAALPGLLEREGIAVDQHLHDELTEFQREIDNHGPFHAFVHGDASVGNAFYDPIDDDVRLIDFESGAFRHALLDGSYPCIRYILSVWARRMPLDLQRILLKTYRDTLSEYCPEASDDEQFHHGLIACSAFWLAAILTYLPSVVEQDRKRGRSTERQRIVAALDHFVRLADDCGMPGALATAADNLHCRLRNQWSSEDCTMRLCNTFQPGE
jgi:hypothetical protein